MMSYFSNEKDKNLKLSFCQKRRKYDERSAMNAIEGAAKMKINMMARKCTNCKHYHLVKRS